MFQLWIVLEVTKDNFIKDLKKISLYFFFKTPSVSRAMVILLCQTQFSRKDQGVYKAVLGDDRGKDTSVFDVSGQGTTVTLSLTSQVSQP